MHRSRRPVAALVLALLVALAACGGGRQATSGGEEVDPGITDDTVTLGGSLPLSGPASAYGTVARAATAYFTHLNETEGGVEMADGRTRRIEYIFYDDGYSPPRTVENARRLISQDQVLTLFQVLGTAPNLAILPFLEQNGVPSLFTNTGASQFGPIEWLQVGIVPYSTEGAIYAEHIKQEFPDGARVAVLYQNDDFGLDYFTGLQNALEGSNVEIIAQETYNITDPSVDAQVTNIAASGANVFVNFSQARPAAQSLSRVFELGYRPDLHLLASVSASIAAVIEPVGFDRVQGVVSSVYLKDPADPRYDDDPGMQLYREVMAAYAPDVNAEDPINMAGMNQAFLMAEMLRRMEPLTREGLLEVSQSMEGVVSPFMIDGVVVNTSPEDDFLMEQMQMMRFEGENWVRFGDIISYEGETPVVEGSE